MNLSDFNQINLDESFDQINPNNSHTLGNPFSQHSFNNGINNEQISIDEILNKEANNENENEINLSIIKIDEKQWNDFCDTDSLKSYLIKSTSNSTRKKLPKRKLFNVEKVDDNFDIKTKSKQIYEKLYEIKLCRKDSYIKAFKTKFVKWLLNKLNKIKSECKFKTKLQNFNKPNSIKFTSNPKIDFNYNKLDEPIKNILIYGVEEKQKNRQFYNKKLLIQIKNFECENKNKFDELERILNLKLREAYNEFYEDEKAYNEMCRDEMMLFYEYRFQLETKFEYSILKRYGLIEVLEKFHKKNEIILI